MSFTRPIRSIFAFVLREMSTSYGRHPGGFIWALAEPIAAITLLTVVFSIAFRAPALGDNFALFYATGYLPFMLYSDLTNKIAQAIKYSKQLLMYPAVNFMDAVIARFLLNLFVHIVVFCIVIQGIMIFTNSGQLLNFRRILNAICMAMCLGLGVGTFNCFLSTRFPVWDRLWGILNRPAFIVSGIFFTLESVPEPYRDYLSYNPLIHVVGEMRGGFYPTYQAGYVSEIYVYGTALLFFGVGLVFLLRNHRYLINNF